MKCTHYPAVQSRNTGVCMGTQAANRNLADAKRVKNDEFYT